MPLMRRQLSQYSGKSLNHLGKLACPWEFKSGKFLSK